MEDFDLTAHANRDDLLDFVARFRRARCCLSHGDEESRRWFEEQIRARHPKMKILVPQPGKAVEV